MGDRRLGFLSNFFNRYLVMRNEGPSQSDHGSNRESLGPEMTEVVHKRAFEWVGLSRMT